jgi:hypothetical protein
MSAGVTALVIARITLGAFLKLSCVERVKRR